MVYIPLRADETNVPRRRDANRHPGRLGITWLMVGLTWTFLCADTLQRGKTPGVFQVLTAVVSLFNGVLWLWRSSRQRMERP